MAARYQYSCVTCGGAVTKPPTGSAITKEKKHGLGGWRCKVHGAVSVVRTILKTVKEN